MYTAQITNANGEGLTLTQNEPKWQVLSITGLNPPSAQINLTNIAGIDGAQFNSSKLNTRNIVIMLRINGNVEENRLTLYRFFRTKDKCTFYFENESRNVKIEGRIETVECNLFTNGEIMQISIICPSPYFKAIQTVITEFSKEMPLFAFPFSINIGDPIPISVYTDNGLTEIINDSESETGVIITINVKDTVNKIIISDSTTNETLTLNYAFQADDQIIINTNPGAKSVILNRSGASSNIFSALEMSSVFFQITVGINLFSYSADDVSYSDKIAVAFTFAPVYRGV